MEDIQWKTIEGYEMYSASNTGQIKNNITGTILKQRINSCGYFILNLSNGSVGKKRTLKVSRLVALAWIPNTDNKSQVNHIDGNKLNNTIENLEWVTASENCIHSVKNNLSPSRLGENNGHSKLTESDVKALRKDKINNGMSNKQLGVKYGISHKHAAAICEYKRWKHVDVE